MDHYKQFLTEKREGKYSSCKYPNLIEIYGDMPTSYFAEVTDELMLAVFRGEEELTVEELYKIAYYNHIPLSVLACPKRIMLDMGGWKHKKMVDEVDSLYMKLKYMAKYERNTEAERYLKFADWKHQRFLKAAYNNQLSYGHYLSAKEQFSNYVGWSRPKPERRGVTMAKAGAAV